MDDLDTREWLLTNGLGSFASGTVCDARTRAYHGWLFAAPNFPSQRSLLLSHLEASLEIAGQGFALGTNFWSSGNIAPLGYQLLQSFDPNPAPTWTWGQADHWQLRRQLLMPSPPPSSSSVPPHHHLLIRYTYQGKDTAILRLRPLIADRDQHSYQQQAPDLCFSQIVSTHHVLLQALTASRIGMPWQLRWSQGHYHPDPVWYWSYYYPEEAHRGLHCLEDLYSPGYFSVLLQPGEQVTLEARVGLPTTALTPLDPQTCDRALQTEQHRLVTIFAPLLNSASGSPIFPTAPIPLVDLLKASDQFVIHPDDRHQTSLIAGYPWFGDRSRDSLLALPGLALATKRFSLARNVLERLGKFCWQGLIPNVLPVNGDDPVYRSLDCSLWWIETLGLYLVATQDWDFLATQYPVVKQIYKAFMAGTLHNIRVDASDGLLTWDDASVPLTWMDTIVDGKPVTPRQGKPVEINALWYSALCWASQWATRLATNANAIDAEKLQNQARRYTQQAEQVKFSLQKFWHSRFGYLFDRIEPDDRLDPTIRPNAVIAISVYHCGFPVEQAQQILQVARDRLLTPYGLRTLDPGDPAYIGRYEGTPWQRDLAYHQGSVWSSLLGIFLRSWQRFYGPESPLPIDLQPLQHHFQTQACYQQISEIFDGDFPHHPRGAIAQAQPIAELIRWLIPNSL
ncbi:amylo-alpha-1,6-glucosidase [Pantanalinema rosaneae CENA516]|uniref:amylo-alpha-1,6-glucosidase n=1 Tax=Pantanalinema rosaneae TaxID=1620701 RepID=UPI003D6E4FD7